MILDSLPLSEKILSKRTDKTLSLVATGVAEDSSSSKIQMPIDTVPIGTVDVINPSGAGRFILVCEHASSFVPAELDGLGLSSMVLESHVAWDPGALAVALSMSEALDAPLVKQNVSRLVYDCNRPPDAQSAVPEISEIHSIPGNVGLSVADRQARVDRFYEPFRKELSAFIDHRIAANKSGTGMPVLVTIHSFTPVYYGEQRKTEIGVLHDADSRLADAMLRCVKVNRQFRFERNEPYGPADGVTHTLVEHAAPRGLLNVMLEIRNDLIAGHGDQQTMAYLLCRILSDALGSLVPASARMAEEGRVEGVK